MMHRLGGNSRPNSNDNNNVSVNNISNIIVNINCASYSQNQIRDVEEKINGNTPKVRGYIYNDEKLSNPIDILLDSGASFSCLDQNVYKMLYDTGFAKQLIPTSRMQPTAANASAMIIIGDAILTLRIYNRQRFLECRNIRFSVFAQLSVPCIIGIEVLKITELKFVRGRIYLNDLHVPMLQNDEYQIAMDVINATTVVRQNEPQTIISLQVKKNETLNLQSITDGDYLLTLILPPDDIVTSRPNLGKNDFEALLMHSSELKGGLHYHFNTEVFRLPKTIHVKLEKVDRERNKRVEDCNFHNKVLSIKNRDVFIDDEIIQNMIKESDFDIHGRKLLEKVIRQFKFVFSVDDNDIGKYPDEQIELELKDPNDVPMYIKPRRIAFALRGWLDEKLSQMIKKDIISESVGSPYNSPIHLVKKKNGTHRITIDLRNVNTKIRGNTYPIPNLFDLLDKLQGAKFFSSIDFRSGFFNLELEPKSRLLTAFSANNKQYIMNRLPQGLKISPSAFQRIMIKICGDLLNVVCLIYLDDLLIYTTTQSGHIQAIRKIFERFGKAGFLLNPDKCSFGKLELNYVGYTINENGWCPKKSNVETIRNFPIPTDKTTARSFTGLCTFYTSAVPCLQYVLGPIHQITGSKTPFTWEEDQQNAFEEAKELLINRAVISFPSTDPNHTLYLTTDASDVGWSAILSQVMEDSIERPIGFSSGRFRHAQLNWPILEKEMFAFVKGVEIYNVYLYLRPFRWRTDNRSLSFLTSHSVVKKDPKRLKQKVLRWLDFISMYDFEIEHHKGTQPCMKTADALSRHFNTNIASISKPPYKKIKTPFWVENTITIGELLKAQSEDLNLQNGSKEWKQFQNRGWIRVVEDSIIYYKKKNSNTLRWAVPKHIDKQLLDFHHLPSHVGGTKLFKKLRSKFIMPHMYEKIRSYIGACELCVAFKKRKKPEIIFTSTSKGIHPFMFIQADLMGPLTQTLRKNCYILVTICLLTRWIEIRPISDKSAQTVATSLMEIFMCRGPPLSIQTDCGREFKNAALSEMLKSIGVRLHHGTPYRPQSQGVVERVNQQISVSLKLLQSEPISWDDDLPSIQLSINLEHHSTLGTSPFMAVHGWVLQRPCFIPKTFNYEESIQNFNGELWAKALTVRMNHAIADLYRNQDKSKSTNVSEEVKCIALGTRVLVYHEQPAGVCGKLYQKWKGLYVIKRQIDRYTYIVYPETAPRKELLVHRERIRILGSFPEVSNEMEEQEFNMNDETPANIEPMIETSSTDEPLKEDVISEEQLPPEIRRSGRTYRKNYSKYY